GARRSSEAVDAAEKLSTARVWCAHRLYKREKDQDDEKQRAWRERHIIKRRDAQHQAAGRAARGPIYRCGCGSPTSKTCEGRPKYGRPLLAFCHLCAGASPVRVSSGIRRLCPKCRRLLNHLC